MLYYISYLLHEIYVVLSCFSWLFLTTKKQFHYFFFNKFIIIISNLILGCCVIREMEKKIYNHEKFVCNKNVKKLKPLWIYILGSFFDLREEEHTNNNHTIIIVFTLILICSMIRYSILFN